jgi:hypothetical protein
MVISCWLEDMISWCMIDNLGTIFGDNQHIFKSYTADTELSLAALNS